MRDSWLLPLFVLDCVNDNNLLYLSAESLRNILREPGIRANCSDDPMMLGEIWLRLSDQLHPKFPTFPRKISHPQLREATMTKWKTIDKDKDKKRSTNLQRMIRIRITASWEPFPICAAITSICPIEGSFNGLVHDVPCSRNVATKSMSPRLYDKKNFCRASKEKIHYLDRFCLQ